MPLTFTHERAALSEMVAAVADLLGRGAETISESDLALRGFSPGEIARHGEAAITQGRALFVRQQSQARSQVVTYFPFDRLGRRVDRKGRPVL